MNKILFKPIITQHFTFHCYPWIYQSVGLSAYHSYSRSTIRQIRFEQLDHFSGLVVVLSYFFVKWLHEIKAVMLSVDLQFTSGVQYIHAPKNKQSKPDLKEKRGLC